MGRQDESGRIALISLRICLLETPGPENNALGVKRFKQPKGQALVYGFRCPAHEGETLRLRSGLNGGSYFECKNGHRFFNVRSQPPFHAAGEFAQSNGIKVWEPDDAQLPNPVYNPPKLNPAMQQIVKIISQMLTSPYKSGDDLHPLRIAQVLRDKYKLSVNRTQIEKAIDYANKHGPVV